MEIWKDIINFEGIYQISNSGKVKSLARYGKTKDAILKQTVSKRGYLVVGLWKSQKVKLCTVHRLIAINFIENPNNKKEVNHKDLNKLNNSLENLEWATPKENSVHAVKLNVKFKNPRGAYKYVYKNKVSWMSQMRVDKKLFHFGYFKTKKEAQTVYKENYLKMYGFLPWAE